MNPSVAILLALVGACQDGSAVETTTSDVETMTSTGSETGSESTSVGGV